MPKKPKKMSDRFSPTSDVDVSVVDWTGVPISASGSLYQNLDESLREPINDADYITTGGPASSVAIFGFSFPLHYPVASYNDGGAIPILPKALVRLYLRAINTGPAGGTLRAGYAVKIGSTTYTDVAGANLISVARTTIGNYSITLTNNPATGSSWTLAEIASASFGFQQLVTAGSEILRVHNFRLEVAESMNVGEQRARLREAAGEPAFFCALCNEPFPRSRLTVITDPDHPHFGRMVCDRDYDDYYPPDDLPPIIEGDIDHEQR